jgi:hypothetical protein
MKRIACGLGAAAIAIVLTACGGDGSAGAAKTPGSGVSASVAPTPPLSAAPAVTPTTTKPVAADPRGYTDADIVKSVKILKADQFGDWDWQGYTPDLLGTEKGLGYKFWGCQVTTGLFNDQTFSLKLEDGTDSADPITSTTTSGSGYVPYTQLGPEGHPHYSVYLQNPGHCKVQLDFISKGSTEDIAPGDVVLTKSGKGLAIIDTPELRNPWHLAWKFDCGQPDRFIISDSGMDNRQIVASTTLLASSHGVFDQYGSAGARRLTIGAGPNCSWSLKLYQE